MHSLLATSIRKTQSWGYNLSQVGIKHHAWWFYIVFWPTPDMEWLYPMTFLCCSSWSQEPDQILRFQIRKQRLRVSIDIALLRIFFFTWHGHCISIPTGKRAPIYRFVVVFMSKTYPPLILSPSPCQSFNHKFYFQPILTNYLARILMVDPFGQRLLYESPRSERGILWDIALAHLSPLTATRSI